MQKNIILLGGSAHGKIVAFHGEDRIFVPKQISEEEYPVKNYDQYSQYAKQEVQAIEQTIDEYRVESFCIGVARKEFAVSVGSRPESSELVDMIAKSWNTFY